MTGEARENEGYIGTWLAVDADGTFLLVGYRDIYERGARLLTNPTRWHVVPEYGNIDWLIRYDLSNPDEPEAVGVRPDVGGNGQGMRMARDGSRVTYLSVVGYPLHSRDLGGFDPRELDKVPVAYATSRGGNPQELAFHPVLPIAASPANSGAIFFHRDTADIQEDRLKTESPVVGQPQRLWFSPDGKAVILGSTSGSVSYLVRADLKLSAAEQKTLATAERSVGPPSRRRTRSEFMPKPGALEALRPLSRRAELSSRDIGREYLDSVVLVESRGTSSTGFVVGSSGYVLTCAHAVGHQEQCSVSFRAAGGKLKQEDAEVVHVDIEIDLALLRVKGGKRYKPVRLALRGELESGERVTVIGNPGVGPQLLTHTMTEGIVSSPARTINGQSLVQFSASVNPGSSGAPLFNRFGEVVGLVILKGRIEGAGFAIPASDLMLFLGGAQEQASPTVRTWRDASGRFEVEAELVQILDGAVELRRQDGRRTTVKLERLSEDDRRFVAEHSETDE